MWLWLFSSIIFDIKMCFSRRWHTVDGLPLPPTVSPRHPPQHGGCIQREFTFRKIPFAGKEDTCNLVGQGWCLSSPRGEKATRKEAALWEFAGGKCCVSPWAEGDCGVWALFVNPGYFNHETSDEQWILWLPPLIWFHPPVLYSEDSVSVLTSIFSPLKWQNCDLPSLCPLASPPHRF